MMNIGCFPTFLPHFPMRDAQQLYNTRFAGGCQQFLQSFLYLFQIFSFGVFSMQKALFPFPVHSVWHTKTALQADTHRAVRVYFRRAGFAY